MTKSILRNNLELKICIVTVLKHSIAPLKSLTYCFNKLPLFMYAPSSFGFNLITVL